jgi:serine O-acetyltransferase
LGGVRIGHGAKIGAMSVVLEDVPPNATAVGIPARIILPNVAADAGRLNDFPRITACP